ncbi:uncharacterized protein [Macrobrachium rosenbergii]|uniref:uncharacterized protein n=1 Tax=Macrobrachium rosenbergii TaxID=79674 RepID=UPI0034D5B7EE
MYEELETPEGERKIHRIAKSRDKNTKDYSHIKQVKDGNGVVFCNEDKIKTSWKGYYEHLLDEENLRKFFEDGFQNHGMTHTITRKEVKKGLKKMKNGKAIGPDGIPAEVWKSLGEEGIDMLWYPAEKMYSQEKRPKEWRESFIVPLYKEKGNIQDCATVGRNNGSRNGRRNICR